MTTRTDELGRVICRSLLIGFLLISAACSGRGPADRVFLGGAVYTVDAERSWAEAVAIRDGAIVYVGDDAGAEAQIGPATTVTRLEGRMLLPGFNDSHCHLSAGGFLHLNCNLTGLADLGEITERLSNCAESPDAGEGAWVLGGGWENLAFPDINPHRSILDDIFPDRPVYLNSIDGHSAWVNSEALRRAGIDRDTPDPPQGIIERDPQTGEPSGTVRDAAITLIEKVIPAPSVEERSRWIEAGMRIAHRYGITSVIEPGVSGTMLEPYAALDRAGRLQLRVLASLSPIGWHPGALDDSIDELLAGRERFRTPHLDVDSVKLYIDGVIEHGTGVLLEPYMGRGDDRGEPFHSQERLDDIVTRLDGDGLQVHVHAIGDRAVRMALDAFAAARETNGPKETRHHIVHLQLIHPDDAGRFGELGVAATFQALWAWPEPWVTELAVPMIGEERAERMYPIGSVHRTGGRIVGGSDWFVSSLNPLEAIEVAVRRQDPDAPEGPALDANERVDLATMLAAYTIEGAWLKKQDEQTGSIEVGKRADLIVLDRNLFEIPAAEINEARVVLTLFDGETVFESEDGPR